LLAITTLFILVLAKIFLTVAYEIRFYDANNYWYNIVFRKYIFFSWLLYIPVISGLILAIAQYYPEINEKRLKLTLHLPVNENTILMSMVVSGMTALLIIFILAMVLLFILCLYYFPSEIGLAALTTVYPWFLAGIAAYLAVVAIFIEPRWMQRVVMIIVALSFLFSLLYLRGYSLYTKSMLSFTILTLIFIVFSIYSTNRFRRGVM